MDFQVYSLRWWRRAVHWCMCIVSLYYRTARWMFTKGMKNLWPCTCVLCVSSRSDQGWIQGGSENGSQGIPFLKIKSSLERKFTTTLTNRMHMNDLEACGKKCCYFGFHSEVCFLVTYWTKPSPLISINLFLFFMGLSVESTLILCNFLVKKTFASLLVIILCPIKGPRASSLRHLVTIKLHFLLLQHWYTIYMHTYVVNTSVWNYPNCSDFCITFLGGMTNPFQYTVLKRLLDHDTPAHINITISTRLFFLVFFLCFFSVLFFSFFFFLLFAFLGKICASPLFFTELCHFFACCINRIHIKASETRREMGLLSSQ